MQTRVSPAKTSDAVALIVIALLCGVLIAAHYRNFEPRALASYFAISISVAALIAIPWLLISGQSAKHLFAKAGLATLALVTTGFVLIRVADTMGEDGIVLVVIANIGAVFGLVTILGMICFGVFRRWRDRGHRT